MLTLSDVTYRIEKRRLLDRASAQIPDGAKVGLVGRNGAGKSTLLDLIRGGAGSPMAARSRCPATSASASSRRRRRAALPRRSRPCSPPTASARGCWPSAKQPPTRCASPSSRVVSPRSARIRRRRAPDGILAGLGLDEAMQHRPLDDLLRRLAHARRAGRGAVSPSPICCCSTSRPTISISKPRSGSNASCAALSQHLDPGQPRPALPRTR